MIDNNWQEMITKSSYSQNKIAEQIDVRRGDFSRVCRGQMVLEARELAQAAQVLGIEPTDIYSQKVLETLYPFDMMLLAPDGAAEAKKLNGTANLRVSEIAVMKLDALVERGKFRSRNRACEEIIIEYKP